MQGTPLTGGRIPLLVALGVATVLGAIAPGEHHLSMIQHGGDLTISHALKMGMPYWYIWILLTPIIVWFVDRVPLEGSWPAAKVLLHLLVAIAVTMLHSMLQNLVTLAFGIIHFPSLAALATGLLSGALRSLTFDLPAYGSILGLLYAAGYYRRFRERERAAATLAVQLAQTQLDALRNQLNPHFFFNAMNSVAMLVRAHRNEEAVRALAGLSELMRYVLQEHPAVEVPLDEELGFLERYLAIERVRLQDRLLLTVRDDGPGLRDTRTPVPSTGVGLRNIRERLTRLYGGEQSLELREADGGGAIARITLPFRTHPAAPVPATA